MISLTLLASSMLSGLHSAPPPPIYGQLVSSYEENFAELLEKIQKRGDLPHVTMEEQLNLLSDLSYFPLGRSLIENRGLDGYWTDYIMRHPHEGRITGLDVDGRAFTELEEFILNRAPVMRATQERSNIFQREIRLQCREGVVLASVPCGLMRELLALDLSDLKDFHLIGADLDGHSLAPLKEIVVARGLEDKVTLMKDDAWNLALPRKADVITSNGLNIYVPEDDRVVELYRQFYENLRPGGCLITSFLTPPPGIADELEWDLDAIDPEAALLQQVVLADILSVSWQSYRSTKLTISQLKEAGFEEIRVISDRAGIFPTVVAYRPGGG